MFSAKAFCQRSGTLVAARPLEQLDPKTASLNRLPPNMVGLRSTSMQSPQLSNQPPSTSTVVPVTKSFLIKNKMAAATSSAVPGRGIGWLAVATDNICCRLSRSSPNIGVSMMPGDTTLIRRGASSGATARQKASTAPPTDASDTCPGFARRAGVPLTSTMVPRSSMCSACEARTGVAGGKQGTQPLTVLHITDLQLDPRPHALLGAVRL